MVLHKHILIPANYAEQRLFPFIQPKTRTKTFCSQPIKQNTRTLVHKSMFNCTQNFQPIQTHNSWHWKPVVPRLGSMGSNPGEPAAPRHGNPWFQGCGSMSSNLWERAVLRNTNTVLLRPITQNKALFWLHQVFMPV